ncbi:DUF1205 domain-containing protein [Solwaraspora sp. WMMA2056]|uniref:nucleotide disphospho-sugar-binding domain-containing protein n=1 Tax=Solwaraspora sp. WMMA2056 TaxID=3015161 RepID=UPI00259AFBE0|nr:nucleotide disphospho-sugar-binding domain-containing protein [Solwaraspora sp. WMMA2056]WJK42568.1 DUF1205 domain-containing protein [Solwaraspora sp. WMMA2056]
MRVLFTMFPSYVHLYPLAPVAWALQSAGHEVRIATHAGFAGAVASVGLTAVALGDADAPEARLRDDAKQPPGPEEVLAYADVMGLNEQERENWIIFYQWLLNPLSDYVRVDLPEAGELIEMARLWKPDVVLWDPLFPAGAVAARVSGAAHGRFLGAALDYFGYSLERLAAARDRVVAAGLPENPLADVMRPLADKYGVEVDDELLLGQWTVDPLPEGVSLVTGTSKVPVRWVPFAGGETFRDWLYDEPERPRIALSLGESARRYVSGDWGRTPKLFEALSDLDVEVVATLNKFQLEGVQRVPDNVRVVEWVPLTQLMPTCSALIHHGGSGTTMNAIVNRIPQLVCDTDESFLMRAAEASPDPRDTGTYRVGREFGLTDETEPEQPKAGWVIPCRHLMAPPWSGIMKKFGAGVRLNHQGMPVDELRSHIQQVITNPSYREGAAKLRDAWANRPAPAAVVPVLERLTAEHRAR